MLGLLSFLPLLLYPLLTAPSPTGLPDVNVNDKQFNNGRTEHPHRSQLQRRAPHCDPRLGQNLVWADCIGAALEMPQSREDVHYHYPGEDDPGDPTIPVIDIPLTSGGDPASPYNVPRSWRHNGCMVSVSLEPGLRRADVTFSTIRYQATMLVNLCVGGGNFLMPGPVHLGLGGNETYKGVRIGVTKS